MRPGFNFERRALSAGHRVVAGLDEAGRGPWAGPVVAAAAHLDPAAKESFITENLNDSKKLSKQKRETVFHAMCEDPSVQFAIAFASVEEIDRLNILAATLLAMERALLSLPIAVDYALVDGNHLPKLTCRGEALIKGDNRSLSIAAASIAAKVSRDREMARLAEAFPGYGWESNQGYGTKAHLEALTRLGPTPHHRRSFRPIAELLALKS